MPSTRDEPATSDPQAFWSDFVLPRLAQTEGISPRDKSGAVAAVRQVLNEELSAMHLAMCSIRTRLNALCPISALPAELLVHIFELYASMRPAGPCADSRRHLGWIEVTHVCKLWRDTAIQSPNLWSKICFKLGSQWTELMLARAKSVPISVRWEMTKDAKENLYFISEHLRRTRELSLAGWPASLAPFIEGFPPSPETLETMELGTADANITDAEGRNSELPGSLSRHRLPSLRRLILRAFYVPWSAPILCGLTHLEIVSYKPCDEVKHPYLDFSHEELFTSLKNMPGLETLILAQCLPLGPWKGDGCDILQLPALKVLRLQGPSTACLGITNRLQIPSSCQVHLQCTDHADISKIIPFLAIQAKNEANLPAWYTFMISMWSDSEVNDTRFYFEIDLWRRSVTLENKDPFDPILPADLLIWFDNDTESPPHLIKSLFQVLPLQTIRNFEALIPLDLSPRDWTDILGRCTELEEVSIYGQQGISFLSALGLTTDCTPIATMRDCSHEQIFLRRLQEVRLSYVDFRFGWGGRGGHASHQRALCCLSARREVKSSPRLEIELHQCIVKGKWVANLEEVADIAWDAHEGACKDEDDSDGGGDEQRGEEQNEEEE